MKYAKIINGEIKLINTGTEILDDKLTEKGLFKVISITSDSLPGVNSENTLVYSDGVVLETIYNYVLTQDEKKDIKLKEIKQAATNCILDKYPTYKQINASLLIYGQEYLTEMTNYIQKVRADVKNYELLCETNLDFEIIY